MTSPDDVLAFWLGDVDERGRAPEATRAQWWTKDPAFDATIRERFEATYDDLQRDDHPWLASREGRVAAVIVLDQFSRNMFRDQPKMYAADARAQGIVLAGLAEEADRAMGYHARYFFYMPLMHAEDLALQERCVALFRSMADDFPTLTESIDQAVGYAERHRDIVARFGRFPHRNAILGRASTDEERAFLEQPGSSF